MTAASPIGPTGLDVSGIGDVLNLSRPAAALAYALRGFRVVPLHSVNDGACSCPKGEACAAKGKHPRLDAWQKQATADPEVVRQLCARWPTMNVGLAMGGPQRLVALDVDGPQGLASLAALEAQHGALPITLTSRSGRPDGGEHRIFVVPLDMPLEAIRNRAGAIGAGLDVRANNSQIVVSPSVHASGNRYAWIVEAPIAQLPRWLFDLMVPKPKPKPVPPVQIHHQGDERGDVVKRARAYLATLPPSIQGSDGSGALLKAAIDMRRGFSLDDGTALALLANDFNPACRPPWSEAEIRHKVASAAKADRVGDGWLLNDPRRARPRGPVRAPREAFYPGEPPPDFREDEDMPHDAREPGDELVDDDLEGPAGLAEPFSPPPQVVEPRDPGDVRDRLPGSKPSTVACASSTTIQIVVGELGAAVDRGIQALRQDPNLYERDHLLVHMTHATEAEQADADGAIIAGTPKIHTLHPDTLRERLCRVAKWEKCRLTKTGVEWVRCEPHDHVVGAIAHRAEWPGLRSLKGIIETPSMRPDGTIIETPGHDRATGYLYVPNARFRSVAKRPTRDDARAAYAMLASLFDDFPYAIPAGQSMAVAAILTLIGRPAIAGAVPAFMFDATSPGSGKTLQVDVCAGTATGREASRQHFPFVCGREKDMELSKVLATLARRGATLVNFDNLDASSGTFGGSALEELITARDTHTFRILGKTEGMTVSWRTVVFGSGNNIEWSRDMGRRILVARLESTLENPEDRPLSTYRHPELAGRLFEHVLEHRVDLVHAALTLLRAYIVADCPDAPTLGSFEAWARLVAGSIVWAGGVNPMACRPSQTGDESPDKAAHRVLVNEWAAFCRACGFTAITAKAITAALYPKDQQGREPDPKWDELRAAIEHFAPTRGGAVPDHKDVAKVLRGFKGTPIGKPARRFMVEGTTGGAARFKVEDVPVLAIEGESA